MNFNIEVRKKQLQSLNQYINSTKDKVESILNYLGWTGKSTLEVSDKIKCPIDKKHSIPVEKLEKHFEKCSVTSNGYDIKENLLSEPQSSSTSVLLDLPKKIEILNEARQLNPKFKPAWNGVDPDPMTSDRLFSTYSSDERLALYDYCIQHTESPPIPNELVMSIDETSKKDETTTLTEDEQLKIKNRDAKRRPVKYKSVHTGRNKNHTEVMREVIQNQMDMYTDYITEKRKKEEEMERKRQQELLEKAQAYEQFPHIDSRVVYDYGIDSFEIPDSSYMENSYNGIISFNVSYDYEADLPPRIEKDCNESVQEHNNHEEHSKLDKRDDYKYRPSSKSSYNRDRERRPRSREREYRKRSERRSRERKDYYPKRSREDRREPYSRSERRH